MLWNADFCLHSPVRYIYTRGGNFLQCPLTFEGVGSEVNMELERERERRPSLQTGPFHSPLDQRERVGLMPGWARTRSAEGVCTRVSKAMYADHLYGVGCMTGVIPHWRVLL